MEIITNAENRKSLVKTLSEHFGERAVYLGPPSFAYQIGSITVDRESKVIFEDDSMEDEVRRVLFQNDVTITEEISESTDETAQDEPVRLTIRIPIGDMTPQGIINLMNMLHSKQYLINRSIGENGFSISDSLTEALNEVKESILNAYEFKTGLTRARLSHMMDDETWFNAKKAVELGFADKILFDSDEDEKKKKPDEPEEKPEKGSDGEEGEKEDDKDKNGKKKLPFQQDSMMFSTKAMNESFLSKVSDRDAMIPVNQLEKRLSLLAH